MQPISPSDADAGLVPGMGERLHDTLFQVGVFTKENPAMIREDVGLLLASLET